MSDSATASFRRRRIHELIEARFEGELAEAGLEELTEYLVNDSEVLREYVEYATLWADLRELAKEREIHKKDEGSNDRSGKFLSFRTLAALSTALAASVAAFFYFSREAPEGNSLRGASTVPAFATLLSSSEASWESGNFTMASRLPAGVLRLAGGFAAIRMDGGASLALQGPAVFGISDEHTLDLHEGKVLVRLREDGDIKVHAPGVTLRDLGTEFGILATTGQQTETRFDIFEGKVEIFSPRTKAQPITMKAGEGGHTVQGTEIELRRTDALPYVDLTNFAPEICVASRKFAKEKAEPKSFTGTTEGILVDKGKSNRLGFWIDVRPDGGKDIGEILVPLRLAEVFSHLFTFNRLRVEWTKNEDESHPMAIAINNLRPKENEGTVTGKVIAKQDDNWIEIQPQKGPMRRYAPQWLGGDPKQGGGLDKEARKLIRQTKLGSKVRVEWIYDERIRIVKLLPLD